MNKAELVSAIAEEAEITKTQANKFLESLVGIVAVELSKGGEVSLVNFGRFFVKQKAARKGRNPATGEPMEIAAKAVPVFKAGKLLKGTI